MPISGYTDKEVIERRAAITGSKSSRQLIRNLASRYGWRVAPGISDVDAVDRYLAALKATLEARAKGRMTTALLWSGTCPHCGALDGVPCIKDKNKD